jgi:tetratricopeptide (TPR) repeat protein
MNNIEFLEIPSLYPNCKGYRIVFQKLEGSFAKDALQKKEQKYFEDLYVKIQEDPQKHIDRLVQFCDRHPKVPEAANLLAFAYLRLKKRKEAEAVIEKTYHEHPDYLIARINYADQALRLGKKELVPKIFNHCFDLNALYPKRENFHYSEFRGFMALMGFYHLEIGEKEKAEEFCQLAFQVDPLHPSVAALEKKLSKISWLKKTWRTLQKLAHISKNP